MEKKGTEANLEMATLNLPADPLTSVRSNGSQSDPVKHNGAPLKTVVTVSLANGGSSLTENGHDEFKSESTCQLSPHSPSTEKKFKVFGGAEAEKKYKMWLRGEVVLLGVVIFIVWGLFSLPIVFYHLPVAMDNPTSNMNTSVNNNSNATDMTVMDENGTNITNGTQYEMCPSVVYDGSVCRGELESLTRCLPGVEQDGSIRVQSDQSQQAQQLLAALDSPLLGASDECKAAARPFLCVYFFGLCDNTGRGFEYSSSQCMEISTGVCAREWSIASQFVPLPDCASFPDESSFTETCDPPTAVTQNAGSLNQTCNCLDGFYCPAGISSLCLPECGSWKQYSHSQTVIIDVVVILSAIIGVISAVAVLVIAGIRRKKVLVFPSTFVVYQTIVLLIIAIVVLINYFDRTALYCDSRDLAQSLETATPFCVISGMIFYYTLIQLALWWLFHVTSLFWKIRFPFHARRVESARRIRYIHIIAVILGILVPLLPVVVTMVDDAVKDTSAGTLGFSITRFPPILCTGIDRDATYYSLALPLNIILIAGITVLVNIFWIVHKQHGLFKARQSKNPFKIGTAERKILVVFCYYIILACIALVSFTLATRNGELFTRRVEQYFICASNPEQASSCSREGFESLTYPVLTSLSYILLGIFPVFNLTFVINVGELKEKVALCYNRLPITHVISDTPSTGTSAVKTER